MLRVLIIYSTHILCFFMCSYFLCLPLLTRSQNPRHPLLRAEIVTQGTRKSNNFNCILCFWLNYFFSLLLVSVAPASYVSHLIVRVRGEYLGCFRKNNCSPFIARLEWHIWLNRGSNIISLWDEMIKGTTRRPEGERHRRTRQTCDGDFSQAGKQFYYYFGGDCRQE